MRTACVDAACNGYSHLKRMVAWEKEKVAHKLQLNCYLALSTKRPTEEMLVRYARRQGVLKAWARISRKQGYTMMGVWLLSVLARCAAERFEVDSWREAIRISTFALSSGFFVALTYSLLRACVALAMIIDAFCFRQADLDHLCRVVPLINCRGKVQSLITLQADKIPAKDCAEHFGDFGLSNAGFAFQEQRPAHFQGQVDYR